MGGDVLFGQAGVDDAAGALVEQGLLHEGHADALDDAAAHLAGGLLGGNDAASVEGAGPAGDADLTGVLVDPYLSEVRAVGAGGAFEGLVRRRRLAGHLDMVAACQLQDLPVGHAAAVPGEQSLVARFHLAGQEPRQRRVLGELEEFSYELVARVPDGRGEGGGGRRGAGDAGPGHVGVALEEADLAHGHAEALGGGLGLGGGGTRAQLVGAAVDGERAVGVQSQPDGGDEHGVGVDRCCHAVSHEPVSVAGGPGERGTLVPAEGLRAEQVGLAQVAAGEAVAGDRVAVGLVAQA